MRIGHGYDVHKLVANRKLIIGGVDIPNEKGLLGHSDADVLVHAIMDCLLGAACEGDIGTHFPDNDISFKNADSIALLIKVNEIIKLKGYRISNIDATIIAQVPKLAPHLQFMRKNIATALAIPIGDINIKATTEEGLGFTGSLDGICAHSVCIIE